MKRHSPLQLVLWLGVALLAHFLVALFGVLNRWLQTHPTPPLPALRSALMVSLLSLASVALVDASSRAAGWLLLRLQRRRRRASTRRQHAEGLPTHHMAGCEAQADRNSSSGGHAKQAAAQAAAADSRAASGSASPTAVSKAAGSGTGEQAEAAHEPSAQCSRAACNDSTHDRPAEPGTLEAPPEKQQQQLQPDQQPRPTSLGPTASAPFGRWDSVTARQPGDALPPPRPDIALQRGLSSRVRSLQQGRPRLARLAALSAITLTFATAYLCQVIAPGFVDPAMIQLVMIWTVIGVAFVQRVLLRHRLPPLIWPCSAVILGGACMILVPTVGRSSGAGLTGWRGWLGFGLSVLSMVSTVFYFISLQASRSMGFATLQLQYLFLLFCILLLLPLSLAIDGTDWTAQFSGWSAHDWVVLAATASFVCVGANSTLQHATWQLGAPTVSIFFGLRLVFSILQSKLLLHATIITQPVQIVGVVVTVSSVSTYLGYQWWQSRQEARSAARKAAQAAAEAATALEGGGDHRGADSSDGGSHGGMASERQQAREQEENGMLATNSTARCTEP